MRFALLRLIRLYQATISPALGVACRYEPSCSHYAYEAIERHGAWRGVRLAAGRLGRCRPGGGSGYDPVPDTDPDTDDLVTPTTRPRVTSTSATSPASDASLR
jgi:putative membrane protein insertion efficiency factor